MHPDSVRTSPDPDCTTPRAEPFSIPLSPFTVPRPTMRVTRTLVLGFAALALAWASALAQRPQHPQRPRARAGDAIRIPFERYALPNGLTVILAPNHATP